MQSIVQYLVLGVILHLIRCEKCGVDFNLLKFTGKVTLELGLRATKPILEHDFINPLPVPYIDSNEYNQYDVDKSSLKSKI